jgi:L-ascorbate metabolism protein UlaG (beta-lactamase superfamily)
MKVHFIRHATFVLDTGTRKILVDPMLSDTGALPPVPLTPRRRKNPLVPLPVEKSSLIKDIDAILLTHYHFDHFDKEAEDILPKNILVFCQPGDAIKLNKKGFINVEVITGNVEWEGISIKRFPAHHGEGSLFKQLLGKSSSYFLQTGADSLFITGDAILDQLLVNSLEEIKPKSVVAYCGAAQFLFGKPITLNYESLKSIKQLLPEAKIVAIHMDAINHCLLTKGELRELVTKDNLAQDIIIPNEGDLYAFPVIASVAKQSL